MHALLTRLLLLPLLSPLLAVLLIAAVNPRPWVALRLLAVGEIAVVQHQPRIGLVGVLVEVINAAGVEAAGPALDAVHHIALL